MARQWRSPQEEGSDEDTGSDGEEAMEVAVVEIACNVFRHQEGHRTEQNRTEQTELMMTGVFLLLQIYMVVMVCMYVYVCMYVCL